MGPWTPAGGSCPEARIWLKRWGSIPTPWGPPIRPAGIACCCCWNIIWCTRSAYAGSMPAGWGGMFMADLGRAGSASTSLEGPSTPTPPPRTWASCCRLTALDGRGPTKAPFATCGPGGEVPAIGCCEKGSSCMLLNMWPRSPPGPETSSGDIEGPMPCNGCSGKRLRSLGNVR